MLDGHFLKKKIKLERMRERMRERIIQEEEEEDTGDEEKLSDFKIEDINRTENGMNEGRIEIAKNDKNDEESNNLECVTIHSSENKNFISRIEFEGICKIKTKTEMACGLEGNPAEGQDPIGEAFENDVTDNNSNLSRLTRTTITLVDPNQDQSTVDNNYYNNNQHDSGEEIQYGMIRDVERDTRLGDGKISSNGIIVTQLQKDYEGLLEDREASQKNQAESENNVDEIMTTSLNAKRTKGKKAKVLEVTKGNRQEPIVKERSSEESINERSCRGTINNLEVEPQNQHRRKNSKAIETFMSTEIYTTIKTVTEDPANRVICVMTSCPPKQIPTNRQTTLNPVCGKKKVKKSNSIVLPLPAVTEDEECEALRKLAQDDTDKKYNVTEDNEIREPMPPIENFEKETKEERKKLLEKTEVLNLPPINNRHDTFQKRRKTKGKNVLDPKRFTRSLKTLPSRQKNEQLKDVNNSGKSKSYTTVELNNLRQREARRKGKKILDEDAVTMYQKNSKGQVVPSGIPFRLV